MYESPIEIMWKEAEEHLETMLKDNVYKVIKAYRINVDEAELLKALRYDRQQYKKGYEDAKAEQKWIPCSERMPEEREWLGTKQFGTTISDEVYVTFESPKGERFAKHLSFQNGKLSAHDQQTIDVFYKGSKPIAWMPLPEPYKGGENE